MENANTVFASVHGLVSIRSFFNYTYILTLWYYSKSFDESIDTWIMKHKDHKDFRGYLDASGTTLGLGLQAWTIHNDSKVSFKS